MLRQSRIDTTGALHHIIARGIERRMIFDDDQDRHDTTTEGEIKVDTVLQNETIWLSQSAIAELFSVNVPAISKHLSNIYKEGELSRE